MDGAALEEAMRNMGRIDPPSMVGAEKTIVEMLEEKQDRWDKT